LNVVFVDASALAAMELEESDFAIYAAALDQSGNGVITEFVVMEVGLALTNRRGVAANEAYRQINATLQHLRIETVALTSDMTLASLQAFERYGKGRHPARLNMGDCLSYGAARVLGLPLLYKGDDFARTDIPSALAMGSAAARAAVTPGRPSPSAPAPARPARANSCSAGTPD
jgi:ribonuclease VapC